MPDLLEQAKAFSGIATDDISAARRFYGQLDRMHREEPNLSVDDLAGYPGPALVMVADDDEMPIEHIIGLHRGLPDAQLAVMPGAGHGELDLRAVIRVVIAIEGVMQSTVGPREEWLEARRAVLEREKKLTRLSEELAEQRRALPRVRIDEPLRPWAAHPRRSLGRIRPGLAFSERGYSSRAGASWSSWEASSRSSSGRSICHGQSSCSAASQRSASWRPSAISSSTNSCPKKR